MASFGASGPTGPPAEEEEADFGGADGCGEEPGENGCEEEEEEDEEDDCVGEDGVQGSDI